MRQRSPNFGRRRWVSASCDAWLAVVMCASAFCPLAADAEPFRVVPSINILETLTNNVDLAPAGQAQSDLVTQITPSVAFSESGRRFSLNGSISVPILLYARTGSEHNQTYVNGFLAGHVEAIEKFFFVDASANASQQFISPFGPQPQSLANASQNRYTAATYTLSPYIKGVTDGNLEYIVRDDNTWTTAYNTGGNSLNDTYYNNLTARISRAPTPFGWSAEYDRTAVTFASQDPLLTQLARLRGYHQIDRQLQLNADVGYEDNDYTFSHFRGPIYGVGGTWRPTDRTNLDAWWEHRFFGSSYMVNFTHRMPRSLWSVNASRGITTYPQQLATVPGGFDTSAYLNQLFLTAIPDPVQRQAFIDQFIRDRGLPSTITSPVAVYSQQISLQEQASATIGLLGARNTILFSVFYLRQQPITAAGNELPGFLNALNNNTQVGTNVTWTHNFPRNVLFALTGTFNRTESDVPQDAPGFAGTTRQFYTTASLTMPLAANTSMNGGVRYSVFRSSTNPGYTEAAIFVSLNHAFR